MKKPCIAVLTTCDTKGNEARYLKDNIIKQGVDALVIDSGILRDPVNVEPDFTKYQIAELAGHTIEQVIATGSRGAAVEIMQVGLFEAVKQLYAEGRIDGLIALGGAEGSVLAAVAMEALPMGVPKLLISPIASGNHKFNEIVRNNDAMVMHSIIDIMGINSISKVIFDNAIGAITGMVKSRAEAKQSEPEKKRIGITILGTVTEAVRNYIAPPLEAAGYEVLTFHANGVGGDCMDKLIEDDYFVGTIEYCINEMVSIHFGGFHVPCEHRMKAAMEKNLPTIIVPGCADLIALGRVETLTEEQRARQMYHHNPEITLVRVTHDEIRTVAQSVAERMNMSKDNVKLLFPIRGFCSQDIEGGELWDHEGDMIFLDVMKKQLRSDIEIIEKDAHINEKEFCDVVVKTMLHMLNQ